MKNFSMKLKLSLLCGFFLLIILATNTYESLAIRNIVESLNDIGNVQLPAVRKMTMVDMYHDGLVGVVYKAIHAGQTGDEQQLLDSATDIAESSTQMNKYLAEIRELPLSSETKIAIESTEPAIMLYLKTGQEIVGFVGKGQNAAAIEKLPEFNKAFGLLEEKLGVLGDLIQSESVKSHDVGNSRATNSKSISLIITILSLTIGVVASFFLIKSFMIDIAEAVENISKNVHDVQNSSQVVQMVSKRLSSSVSTQASSITESVTAMDEISSMLQNNNLSASKALDLSDLTKKSAESGKITVNKMQDEMKEISASYDEIQESIIRNKEDISKIIEVIQQIASKTAVINDIVFQTKLLSFNASVEAARAGESGKGFAVVAEEVGNLAIMSGKASKDIEDMLKDSQDQVNSIATKTTENISGIVHKGRSKIQSGNDVSSECLKELEQILNFASDLNVSINEISNAMREQSLGVEEVNISLKQLDNATHEASDMSEKSKGASDGLNRQSHSLRVTIQGLRKILGSKKDYDAEPFAESNS